MTIKLNNATRALIYTMIALVLVVVTFSYFYYGSENSKNDPRVIEGRQLYDRYNEYTRTGNYKGVLQLMDSIESVYAAVEHYKSSYEIGVLYNNRAATYLSVFLTRYEDPDILVEGFNNLGNDSLLHLAKEQVLLAIGIYENWFHEFDGLNASDIQELIGEEFLSGLDSFSEEEQHAFLEKRVEELETAKLEVKRRLSVSYTNLGIVYRHQEEFQLAADQYKTALKLWSKNLTAENNLNMLMGKPLEKRNFIQRMFPTDKEKED